jgi:hypothetical protein
MKIRLLHSELGLRNSTTRIPFRYGSACLIRCPQAILRVQITADGRRQHGYSGDCLPPSWFDKDPQKEYRAQIADMLGVIALAQREFADRLAVAEPLFPAWRDVSRKVHAAAAAANLPGLLASLGVSLVERAVMDAVCRAAHAGLSQAVRANLFAIEPGAIHAPLRGVPLEAWLPPQPLQHVYVRHTVGLADPLVDREIPRDERLDDGYPQSLEQYVRQLGVRYFKIKVSNRLDADLDRLRGIARVIERQRGSDYHVTLDGNEQYGSADEFLHLVDRLSTDPALETLWRNTLLIEQPLHRQVALSPDHSVGIAALCRQRPVIIDESDEEMDSFAAALELGYRGVSSKNCKGPIRSLLNAGLVWWCNERGGRPPLLISGEDLCSVGIVPVQSDLCLAATLGISHVERNGHHYHPGLTYLPSDQQEAALRSHPDFYTRDGSVVRPHVQQGRFHIQSLHGPGFGFAVEPRIDSMIPASQWRYESLGLA